MLITSLAKLRRRASRRSRAVPARNAVLVVDGDPATAALPDDLDSRGRSPAIPTRRSPTSGWARRCSTRRARPAGRRASCGRCPSVPPSRAAAAVRSSCTSLWRYREDMIYLSPAPLYHSAPQAAVGLTIRMRRHRDHHGALRSRAVPGARRALPGHPQPARADDVQPHAQAARRRARRVRPVVARDRRPRRRAVPGAGEGADDRVVGPDHPRVLRRHRRHRLHGLRHRRSGCAHKGTVGKVHARRPAHPRRRACTELPNGHAGHDLVRDRRRRSSTSTTRRRPPRRAPPTAR